MNEEVVEGSLVRLQLVLKQEGQQTTAEAEVLYGFQSVLPAIDEQLKGKKEGEQFSLTLYPKQTRRWRNVVTELDLNRPVEVQVFINKVERPNPDELLYRVRQLFAGCGAGG